MKHLRAQLEKFKASAESYAKANETLGYPMTAARYEGEATAYATAIALLDGATRRPLRAVASSRCLTPH